MKHLKKFSTLKDYESYIASDEFIVPNVSLISDISEIKYHQYQPYNYIAGDGTAYLEIDYYLSNYDRIEVQRSGSPASTITVGAKSSKMMCTMLLSQESKGYFIWRTSTSHFLDVGDVTSTTPFIMGMVKEGDFFSDKVIRGDYNHTLYAHSTPPAEVISDIKLRVFAGTLQDSNEIDSRIFSGKIYYVKVIDSRDESIKLDLVPAMVGNEVGMYDNVSGKFYKNANSVGSFTLG